VKVSHADDRYPRTVYDRQLLLFGVKRDAVLDLREVERYGLDCFADADYVSVYGMRPADWYTRGIRLLGRTTVECTRDALADAIAGDVAALARSAPSTSSTSGAVVIDPFVGSGNTLYWIVRRMTGCAGLGLELDARVCELTKRNLAIINSPIQIVNTDYVRGLAATTTPSDRLVVVFIAPPWGHALDPMTGLDLPPPRARSTVTPSPLGVRAWVPPTPTPSAPSPGWRTATVPVSPVSAVPRRRTRVTSSRPKGPPGPRRPTSRRPASSPMTLATATLASSPVAVVSPGSNLPEERPGLRTGPFCARPL
jgi:hypothetical protein